MNLVHSILVLTVFLSTAVAQTVEWDTTGNGLLKGTYNFREALWITDAQASNPLDEAASQFGTITFDGQGNYTVNATAYSSIAANNTSYTRSGVYAISSSGFGFIRRSANDGGDIYGSVARGVFIGSSTESGFNNLWIAALKSAATPSLAAYNAVYVNLATASMTQIRDANFRFTPASNGSLGTLSVTGYTGGNYTAATQSVSAASYSFNNATGTGTLTLGAKNTTDLISGTIQFFTSPDGQFLFGGATNGWDMFVATLAPLPQFPASSYNGLYFQAGMDIKRSALPSGTAVLNSYFGALNPVASIGQLIGHERIQSAPDTAYDFTYSDFFTIATDGTHDDFLGLRSFLSADGNYSVAWGRGDYLGLNIAVKAPSSISSGNPFIDPTGVVNAASFTPFTTGIAPGELITIFGANLATGNFTDATFPTTLGGVTVTINGKLAPVYVVTPSQISAIVPYETTGSVAEIQISRSGIKSNRVTAFVNRTAPGVFAVPPTGLGYAAALHPDYSLVTPQNPARVGETIAVYLTGLGAVNPSVPNGAAGPVTPLSKAVETLDVRVGNKSATVAFAGLAPTLKGLYQLNITIPSGVSGGDQYLDISGPDTLNSQIVIPIATSGRGAAEQTPHPHGRR